MYHRVSKSGCDQNNRINRVTPSVPCRIASPQILFSIMNHERIAYLGAFFYHAGRSHTRDARPL